MNAGYNGKKKKVELFFFFYLFVEFITPFVSPFFPAPLLPALDLCDMHFVFSFFTASALCDSRICHLTPLTVVSSFFPLLNSVFRC